MSAFRVGSKTRVTLFKGDELYGMLLTPEKAVEVVRGLGWAATADGDGSWLAGLSNAQLRVVQYVLANEQQRRGDGGDVRLLEVDHLLEMAWAIIANCGVKVSGGWPDQDPEWVAAAERWRDGYHEWLGARRRKETSDGPVA